MIILCTVLFTNIVIVGDLKQKTQSNWATAASPKGALQTVVVNGGKSNVLRIASLSLVNSWEMGFRTEEKGWWGRER